MSARTGNPFKVNAEALRFIVKSLEGDLRLSEDPSSPGREFFESSVRDVQYSIAERGLDEFVADARGHAAGYGGGTPLDALRPVELLHIAAAVDATEFEGEVFRDDWVDLNTAVRWTLVAIYDDVFSAVGAALEAGELKVFRGSLVRAFKVVEVSA